MAGTIDHHDDDDDDDDAQNMDRSLCRMSRAYAAMPTTMIILLMLLMIRMTMIIAIYGTLTGRG
jgi:hypothetical protein